MVVVGHRSSVIGYRGGVEASSSLFRGGDVIDVIARGVARRRRRWYGWSVVPVVVAGVLFDIVVV